MTYTLWHYLTESAQRYPDRPAVAGRELELSYGELDRASTRLANLLAENGIGPGARVGLYLKKSVNSVVSMLGVLKSGAAYVPVDPKAPARRGVYILADCAVSGLITTTDLLKGAEDLLAGVGSLELVVLADDPDELPTLESLGARVCRWRDLDGLEAGRLPPVEAIESDPAYLLYTSGSTGNPKGVILSHRHALTFVDWGGTTFDVRPDDCLSNHAPHHFDLSVFDIYAALRAGACVALVPDEISPFPVTLAQWIEDRGISIWYSVPSALTRLLLHGQLERYEYRRLRTVLFAGEVFPVKYLRGVMERLAHAEFYNLYGPTETNVCTYYRVPRPLGPDVTEIPIGAACANTDVVVLDEENRRVGSGGTGELLVRGPALMQGYWGLPDRTDAVLIRNPLQPAYGERLYRTGDLVRVAEDGSYFFVGRKDHMVKSRGYRIELGEIEQALYAHQGVKEAVVIPVPDEEIGSRLHAVVAPHADSIVNRSELQAFCLDRLPRYMVPEQFVFQKELPKTSTGKIDRMALTRAIEADGERVSA